MTKYSSLQRGQALVAGLRHLDSKKMLKLNANLVSIFEPRVTRLEKFLDSGIQPKRRIIFQTFLMGPTIDSAEIYVENLRFNESIFSKMRFVF